MLAYDLGGGDVQVGVGLEQPGFYGFCVQDGLGGGEGFRVYQDQRGLGVKASYCALEVDWVYVGEEADGTAFAQL